jgi:hypothetical protein
MFPSPAAGAGSGWGGAGGGSGSGSGRAVLGREVASGFDGGEGGVQEGGDGVILGRVDCIALHGWGIRNAPAMKGLCLFPLLLQDEIWRTKRGAALPKTCEERSS